MTPRKKKVLWGLAVAVAAVAVGWTWFGDGEEVAPVATARIERGTLEIKAAASGRVEADIQVEVKSRASGEVIEINVQAGDKVEMGDLLVRLDPADEERRLREAEMQVATSKARLAQARSGLASARADMIQEESRYKRRRSAYKNGLVSGEELQASKTAAEVAREAVEQRRADVTAAEADLSRTELAIEEARKRLSETIIKAPVSGTVLSVAAERGSIVSSGITNVGGGTTLMTLADLSNLFVLVKLDEASIGSVREAQDVSIRVDAFPTRSFSGRVERVTPLGVAEANIVTFDLKVRITDRSANLLLPGMSTDVEIVTGRFENVLLVPNAAIRRDTSRVATERMGEGGRAQEQTTDRSMPDATPAPDTAAAAAPREDETTDTGRRRQGGWSSGEGGLDRSRRGRGERGGGYERRDSFAQAMDTPAWRTEAMKRDAPPADVPPSGRAMRRGRGLVKMANGEEKPIVTGATDGMKTIVLEGLSEGDEVILSSGGRSNGDAGGAPRNPFMPRGGGGRR